MVSGAHATRSSQTRTTNLFGHDMPKFRQVSQYVIRQRLAQCPPVDLKFHSMAAREVCAAQTTLKGSRLDVTAFVEEFRDPFGLSQDRFDLSAYSLQPFH